ncbi:hypothetical protein LQR30_07475 [Chromobacterium piscinae]|uniref:hypothetical protein n=1 Tax=Chromobacterium piscinae TaxID=686831 RepID=UPI001E2F5127|nr:hypothetical protein [Chromobacterium piscinae]MCD4503941.1 hypothetical protein [Chromobacterium piscinae]
MHRNQLQQYHCQIIHLLQQLKTRHAEKSTTGLITHMRNAGKHPQIQRLPALSPSRNEMD